MFCLISCIFRPWLHHLLPGWEAALLHGERPGEELEALCSNPAPLLCHDDCPVTDVWLQTPLARWEMHTPFFTAFFFLISHVFIWFFFFFFTQHIMWVKTRWCAIDFPCSWIDGWGFLARLNKLALTFRAPAALLECNTQNQLHLSLLSQSPAKFRCEMQLMERLCSLSITHSCGVNVVTAPLN